MAWISFGVLPCRKKKTWWQLASRCCWNRARPWHASELVTFLVGLRTCQNTGNYMIGRFYIIHFVHYSINWLYSPTNAHKKIYVSLRKPLQVSARSFLPQRLTNAKGYKHLNIIFVVFHCRYLQLYVYSLLFQLCHWVNIYSYWLSKQFCNLSLNIFSVQ